MTTLHKNILNIISLLIFLAILVSGVSKVSLADQKKSSREPLTITSKTLTADNKTKTAVFQGTVKAVKGDMTLYADKMIVYYQDERPGNSIEKIESEGNVKLVKGDRVVTSAFAQYFGGIDERVVFTGEPRATDGVNVITGLKMTYFLRDERYIVENSKVLLQDSENLVQKKK